MLLNPAGYCLVLCALQHHAPAICTTM